VPSSLFASFAFPVLKPPGGTTQVAPIAFDADRPQAQDPRRHQRRAAAGVRVDDPPAAYKPREWEKPHQANLTGTARAYRPPGSILHRDPRTPARPDYEPWSPEG